MDFADLTYIMKQLIQLCSISSPAGNTQKIMDYLSRELDELGISYNSTHKGALIATISGKERSIHRHIVAHVDTLGAMVKEIKPNGRLKLTKIGGYNWNSLEGALCYLETGAGNRYSGTILNTHASVHVYEDHAKQERNDDTMEVRIDEKVKNQDDVAALGIAVGDFVSFDPRLRVTDSGFINSRHLDDKASAAVLLGVLKYLRENNLPLPYTTNIMFSNNEEIGYGGNAGITPETKEYLVVDMGAVGEGQATDEFCVSICAKDSSGPYHFGLRQKLVQLAQEHKIYYKVDVYPHYGSDASSALRAGFDIVHGLIGPGIDASHGHERTHKEALANTAGLLLHYLLAQ
ncbi:M42 family metallopeptidase [Desulfosporosinus sp. PR]|uniref:M42 family metallopeptidase n=1 Tax=Candidatus Desulfosporosinus nitrosoreducens TaxID=3401928 RepID=UPI0027F4A3C6|nr:M42 family metallopeptidase [Desulfosporosinus sp. PR]MDQ7094054.1 M42 family metallopeptidase [Desulfosporosinus sp. PR]